MMSFFKILHAEELGRQWNKAHPEREGFLPKLFVKQPALASLLLQKPFLYPLRNLLHITPKDASSGAGFTTSGFFIVFEPFVAGVAVYRNMNSLGQSLFHAFSKDQ